MLLAATTLLFATSCMDGEHCNITKAKVVSAQFSVSVAQSASTRTIADGKKVDEVAWAIYENGELATDLTNYYGTLKLDNNQQAQFAVSMVLGRTYDIAFFAYKADGEAVESMLRQPNAKYYNVLFADKKIELKTENLKANDDELDCFWLYHEGLEISGPIIPIPDNYVPERPEDIEDIKHDYIGDNQLIIEKGFTLTRPVAKLNFAAEDEDIDGARNSGFTISDTALEITSYTSFNIAEGKVDENSVKSIKFSRTDSPIDDNSAIIEAKLESGEVKSFKCLAMTYLFANPQQLTSGVTLHTWDQYGEFLNTISCESAPMRRNHNTLLVGNLLSNSANFSIIISNAYDNPNNNYDANQQ